MHKIFNDFLRGTLVKVGPVLAKADDDETCTAKFRSGLLDGLRDWPRLG